MPDVNYSYVAFADESNWNIRRFRSISLVSCELHIARQLHEETGRICNMLNVEEIKWASSKREHIEKLMVLFFSRFDSVRVDVLIWDIEDSRHKNVLRRDDRQNFARMYYHLLHNVLKRRWPNDAKWLICPDKHDEVNWDTLETCLAWKSWIKEGDFMEFDTLNKPEEFIFNTYYNISEFRCVCSKEYMPVQLADVFAGIAAFSYSKEPQYSAWKAKECGEQQLFQLSEESELKKAASKRDIERFSLLYLIERKADRFGMGISVDEYKGLFTKNPNSALNFWLYRPQRESDKAPTKKH